jgi:hypothetical protein
MEQRCPEEKQKWQIAQLQEPDLSPFDIKIAIAKLKRYKFPGVDQILAELIKAGGETLCSEIHKLIV